MRFEDLGELERQSLRQGFARVWPNLGVVSGVGSVVDARVRQSVGLLLHALESTVPLTAAEPEPCEVLVRPLGISGESGRHSRTTASAGAEEAPGERYFSFL